MCFLKKWFVVSALVAVAALSLEMATANADWVTPISVWDHSPDDGITIKTDMIDGDQNTYYKLIHDGVSTDPAVTNYVVLDLGEVEEVSGFKFWPRIHASANTGPKDLDIFYCQNEALMPADGWKPNTTATLAADSNVIIAASRTLPGIHGEGEYYETALSPSETFEARYVGLWCRSSHDGTPAEGGVAFYAEVQFDATPIPEPNAFVLLLTGLCGLVCYAWRKRK